jgi:GYF domain 2
MSSQYFIVAQDGQKSGPYDVVSIVKRIRNGGITTETLVSTDKDPSVKAAGDWPELAEFLQEQNTEETKSDEPHKVKSRSLAYRAKSGWNFLQFNQLTTIFSGLYVLFAILSAGMVSVLFPKSLQMLGYSACFILTQFFFTGYMYSVLRMVRGQPVDYAFIKDKMKPLIKPLLITSLMMSFFIIIGFLCIISGGVMSTIGLMIVALPGFYSMSLYIFAPLLILDKGMDFWEALELSRKTVQKSGLENTGVIFALLIINFLAGMFFLIPMIVSLPITIGAISDMYDESFA